MSPVGQRAVEWARKANPLSSSDRWARTHAGRMYALGLSARWLQPTARFVVVTPGRSGSELLADLLNSHPSIVCEAEILRERVRYPDRFVAGRAAKAGLEKARAYGFKIYCGHVGYQVLHEVPDLLERLAGQGCKIVFLRRDNHLAQGVSAAVAAHTRWHWLRQERPEFIPLALDPVEVLMHAYQFENSDAYLQYLVQDLPHVRLTYEHDLLEPEAQMATVARICDDLAVPRAPVSSGHVRFTPRRLSETMTNFEDLVDVVRATRYARFLDGADGLGVVGGGSGSESGVAVGSEVGTDVGSDTGSGEARDSPGV